MSEIPPPRPPPTFNQTVQIFLSLLLPDKGWFRHLLSDLTVLTVRLIWLTYHNLKGGVVNKMKEMSAPSLSPLSQHSLKWETLGHISLEVRISTLIHKPNQSFPSHPYSTPILKPIPASDLPILAPVLYYPTIPSSQHLLCEIYHLFIY